MKNSCELISLCSLIGIYFVLIFRTVIDFDEMAGGLNKRRMIQSAVFKELMKVSRNAFSNELTIFTSLLDTDFFFPEKLPCVQYSSIIYERD